MAVDIKHIGKVHAGLLVAAGGAAYVTHWVEPGSLLLGGAVMGVNFYLLWLISTLLRPEERESAHRRRAALAVAAFVLKFGLFLGLLGALFWRVPIEGMSFALGVTLLLVACVVETARHEWSAAKGVR
jgi:hypothetical protein